MLLALTALMMVGCDYKNQDGSYDTSRSISLKTIAIDSCEYIAVYEYHALAHKGNCKYCKERRQKEVEELIKRLKKK